MSEHDGSMLLFLPGVGEIDRVHNLLAGKVANDVDICPLYGALTLEQQQKAIQPAVAGRRKIVLATNIAETSLTIEGIRLVVDSGLERSAQFDPRSGLTRLITQRISQASMTQRAGRAGRLEPGLCWHLLPKSRQHAPLRRPKPEIVNSDSSHCGWICCSGAVRMPRNCVAGPAAAPELTAAQKQLIRLGATDNRANCPTWAAHGETWM